MTARGRKRTLLVLGILLMLILGVWLVQGMRRWLAIDRCLDLGGRWDYSAKRCQGGHQRPHTGS